MIIWVSSGVSFEQTGWTVGYCGSCNRFEAVRVCEKSETVAVLGIEGKGTAAGRARLCEWCDEPVKRAPEAGNIPLADWNPGDGLKALFERCAPDLLDDLPSITTKRELRALLSFIERRSALNSFRMEGGPAGCGCLIGIIVAIPVAIALIYLNLAEKWAAWVFTIGAGAFFGAIISAVVAAVAGGRRLARKKVFEMHFKYGVELGKLATAAEGYSRRIRAAAQQLVETDAS
jgi:hypothetical protein